MRVRAERMWGKRMGKNGARAKGERYKKAFSHSAHLLRARATGVELQRFEVEMRQSKCWDHLIRINLT